MKGFMGGWSSGRTGVAEPPEVMEALVQRVRTLRASIESSEGYAESTAAVLGSYEQRIADIDAAMRPIQVSRQAAQRAHDNIDRAIRAANDILAQVVTAREVRASALLSPPLRFCVGCSRHAVRLPEKICEIRLGGEIDDSVAVTGSPVI
ncbi:hypothetical protein ACQ4PT_065115 [Festuca glaucescens]